MHVKINVQVPENMLSLTLLFPNESSGHRNKNNATEIYKRSHKGTRVERAYVVDLIAVMRARISGLGGAVTGIRIVWSLQGG